MSIDDMRSDTGKRGARGATGSALAALALLTSACASPTAPAPTEESSTPVVVVDVTDAAAEWVVQAGYDQGQPAWRQLVHAELIGALNALDKAPRVIVFATPVAADTVGSMSALDKAVSESTAAIAVALDDVGHAAPYAAASHVGHPYLTEVSNIVGTREGSPWGAPLDDFLDVELPIATPLSVAAAAAALEADGASPEEAQQSVLAVTESEATSYPDFLKGTVNVLPLPVRNAKTVHVLATSVLDATADDHDDALDKLSGAVVVVGSAVRATPTNYGTPDGEVPSYYPVAWLTEYVLEAVAAE